jgi:N-methylhydantoinase B
MPGDIFEVTGEYEELQLRQEEFVQNPADVYAVLWAAAGGLGDPLERDPGLVESDVEHLNVTEITAREVYGVALRADGSADGNATEQLRATMRKERLARARMPAAAPRKAGGKRKFLATAMLAVQATTAGPRHACAKCETDLGSARENFKEHCARDDRPIQASNPIVGDPARFIDDLPQFRQFYCPGCGALIENEIAISSEPLLRDVELRLR